MYVVLFQFDYFMVVNRETCESLKGENKNVIFNKLQ